MPYYGLTMHAEPKKLWLEALRSEKYPQYTDGALVAFEQLSDHQTKLCGFCCLGVFGVIEGLHTIGSTTKLRAGSRGKPMEGMLREKWFSQFFDWDKKLYTDDEKYEHSYPTKLGAIDKAQGKLSDMNDEGKPFPDIANWIEANL